MVFLASILFENLCSIGVVNYPPSFLKIQRGLDQREKPVRDTLSDLRACGLNFYLCELLQWVVFR